MGYCTRRKLTSFANKGYYLFGATIVMLQDCEAIRCQSRGSEIGNSLEPFEIPPVQWSKAAPLRHQQRPHSTLHDFSYKPYRRLMKSI